MRNIIKLSFLIGFIFGLNHIIGLLFTKNYTPFHIYNLWEYDEMYYAAKIHYFSLTNTLPSIYTFSDAFPTVVFGLINKVVSMDIIFIIAPFIFIPVLFYLIYTFHIDMGVKHYYAIMGAVCILFLSSFWANIIPHDIFRASYEMISYYGRFPSTMFTGIVFYTALICIKRKMYVTSGIMAGILMYSYFYFVSFIIFLLCVLCLINRRYMHSLIIFTSISWPALYIAANTPDSIKDIMGRADSWIPMVPQTFHYHFIIVTPLIMFVAVMIMSRYSLLNRRLIYAFIAVVLLLAINHQVEYGLEQPKHDADTDALREEFGLLMYDNHTHDVYPVLLGRNNQTEVRDHLQSIGINTSEMMTTSYWCHMSCDSFNTS